MNIEEQKAFQIAPVGIADLRDELLNKNLTEIMRYMLILGWSSDCHLSASWDLGVGFAIHFSRWDWHGRDSDKINFHSATSSSADTDLNLCARLAAEKALRAWETFTDVLPGAELVNGKIPAAWEGVQEIWLG